ncbi:unnamed protein product [Fusarium langsethiae]|nr:unnamed protein product [Fusarium langsethiae]
MATRGILSNSLKVAENVIDIPKPVSLLNDDGRNPGSFGVVIVPMTTLGSSCSVPTAQGVDYYTGHCLASIMVAISYLEAVGSPLWNAVRGDGFAYGFSVSSDSKSGIFLYHENSSPNACKAIKASKEAIGKIADGLVEIDHHMLEGAISRIAVKLVDKHSNMPEAAIENIIRDIVDGLPKDWSNVVQQPVRDVTIDDNKTVLRETVLSYFEPGESNVVVAAARIMQEGMEASFKEMGYKVHTCEPSYFHDGYGLGAQDGEEEGLPKGNEELGEGQLGA